MLGGHYIVKNKDLNMEKIAKNLNRNSSVEITRAVRNTKVDNLEISEGDYIAMVNGKNRRKGFFT